MRNPLRSIKRWLSDQRGSVAGTTAAAEIPEAEAGGTPPWWPPEPAASILDQRDYVVPVLGAGVGQAAGLPGSADLAGWVAENFPSRGASFSTTTHLFNVVDEVDSERVSPADLQQGVADHLKGFDLKPTPLTMALVRVPSRLIINLSYDGLLEASAEAAGVPYRSYSNLELKTVLDLISERRLPEGELTILHLHGSVDQPESIVLDHTSYQDLSARGEFFQLVFILVRQYTLCFVGTKLDELHIRDAMRRGIGTKKHVLVCPRYEEEELRSFRAAISEQRDGIVVAPYPDHADLPGFAANLTIIRPIPIPPEPSVAALDVVPSDLPYVANVLYDRSAAPADEEAALAAAILGGRYGPDPLPEDALALGHRTLVVGAPGSGKSELLRRVGALVPPDEQPLLIRCAEMSLVPGDASTVLSRWAERGRGLRGDTEVSPEALRQRRFHFFFDGLDEVAPDRQQEAALLVSAIAEAFPQHRFTIATRPVDAVNAFDAAANEGRQRETQAEAAEWRVLDLAPDRDWQRRFLDTVGISLVQLEETMPALRDLGELLQLPFFAAQTVTLYRQERLRDLPDLWGLVEELTSLALDREAGLPLQAEQTRHWLRRVALAMHLAGRGSLTLHELEAIPLPDGLVGETAAISETLVLRLLFQEREGGYTFVHRIVGESLAAEALDEHDPSDVLLDAIVPVRDDEVRGARSDWLVPLSFLLSRNETWRRAVAERDPLQAARTVPATADRDERADAARLIWRTYVGWGIWIWDYDAPDLVEDAEVLGRLLRTEAMDEVIEEVRADIEHESDQVQGNAIRVLSRVNPSGFVDDLRRVLEDDARAPVVRRQAAIAARDLDLHELLPQIVARAESPEDSAEAQDCSAMAMELATDDEVVDVAIRLTTDSHSRISAVTRLERRVGGAEMLRFLRAYAANDPDRFRNSRERALLTRAVQEVLRHD